ncbi:MAG: lipopolysaccharide heptosyltransferase II [Candidatus Omnitrophica bacterium]|nr:lipopolysaccharide heptosyltransferase II [Candidatus Omnitrophota bacterium]
MRILQILPELNVGGVETGTVDFANYLVQHGHDSVVISHGGSLVKRLTDGGSRHYPLAVHKKSLFTAFRMIKKVRDIILKEKIQIVHARSRVPAWIAYFACRKTEAHFITTCHGFYRNRIFSQIMGWPKMIIVPSEAIARHMIDHYKVPQDNLRCIPRSVDLNRFDYNIRKNKKDGSCVIAIIGRLTTLKGHPYFLQAMAKVVRHSPQAKIWIIGDAPVKKAEYKQELETLATRLGIRNNVEFLGNRQDIPELLSQVDVLCFSSIEPESFGRAIVEAQAMKVPVVATRVGGVVDIIDDGITGLLVFPKEPDMMAEKVLYLLKNKSEAQKMTEAALEKIHQKFTLDHMAESTLAVYEELLQKLNILVIKISAIGDVVLVTASLKALRKKFPQARIYCLVGNDSKKILHQCPYLDGLIIYDHNNKDKSFLRLWRLGKKLREHRFDKVIDFQNNRKSHLLAFLSMAQERYGFKNKKWSNLLTHPLADVEQNIPAVEHQFQILQRLGIEYRPNTRLEMWPGKKDEEYIQRFFAEEWLANSKQIVGINISASAKWPTKNWPVDFITELCDKLALKNIRVILTGMEKDRPMAQFIQKNAKSKPSSSVGKTDILQLAVLIRRCQVYVTPDSAPLHVAAAVDVPIISLFGPTDHKRHVPPANKLIVNQIPMPCAPCYSDVCKIKTHECMKKITVDTILKQIETLLT